MKRLLTVALALAAPALAYAASPAPIPIYKEIGDWVIACDNTRACTAKSSVDEASADAFDGVLVLEREAGPAGKTVLRTSAEDPFIPAAKLDGQTLPAHWTAGKDGDQRLEGEPALAFVRAIRNGKRLTLANKDRFLVSLKGLSAVLLAMDEAQGRLGTTTALARTGPAAAATVPPPFALPTVHAAAAAAPLTNGKALISAVRKGQLGRLKAADCDLDDPTTAEADDAQPLTATEAVVLLGCLRGAYQGSELAFRVPRAEPAKAQLLILPKTPGQPKDESSSSEYGDAGYDPKSATFSSSAKGRGPADCGVSQTWVFDGSAFQPATLNYLERCSGGEPGDWPALYRTRTTR